MGNSKIVILVLVLIGLLAFMALGAGAYRDRRERGNRPRNYSAGPGTKLLDRATGWMRSEFDTKRLSGCGAPALPLVFAGECRLVVGEGSSRPSKFTLEANPFVTLCFALTSTKLEDCVRADEYQLLENSSDFTVAGDSAFLALRCHQSSGNCIVEVTRD
jgi:hypothetical protein